MADRTNPHAEIIVGATDNASKVFDKVKQSAQGMAAGVEQSAKKTGEAVKGIGSGAQPAAQELDRATKSIIGSIQRATAQFEAGERASGKYFETLARQRGANVEALRPYIDQLESARKKQDEASKSMGGMALSAGQLTMAMRQLPMQFTDIAVGLATGQKPMMVMLQQGGQLKDVFGGIVPAAKAMAGYIAGLINPFTLAAAAVGGLSIAYRKGAAEQEAFQRTLILTGNAVGSSANQLGSMAASIDKVTYGITQSKAAATLAEIASQANIGASSLERYTNAALQFERAGGGAAQEVSKAFADIARDPVNAILKLNESMRFLTASTYEQIKSLAEQGRTLEAAKVASDAYASALESRIPKLEENLGSLERAWRAIKGTAAEAWDSMLGVGRADTLDAQIAQLEKTVAAGRANPIVGGGYAASQGRARQAENEAMLDALREQKKLLDQAAQVDRERARQEEARIKWMRDGEKFLSDQVKMEREIAKARQEGLRAGASQEEIEKRIAKIREDYTKKPSTGGGRSGKSDAQRELEVMEATLARLSGVNADYVKQLEIIQKARESGRITEEQSIDLLNELISKQPMAIELMRQQADAEKEIQKAREQLVQAQVRSAETTEKQVQKLKDEEEALIVAANLNISLAQALEAVAIKRLEEAKAKEVAKGRDADQEVIAAIEREIKARKELAELMGKREQRENMKKAAEEAAKAWEKTADEISQGLTDALMRGFEDGKSFGENFVDSLKNMFKTQLAKALQQSIAQALGSAFSGQGFNFGSLFGGGQGGLNWGDLAQKAYGYFGGGASTASIAATYGTTAGSQQTMMLAAQEAGMAAGSSAAASWMSAAASYAGWIGLAVAVADNLYSKGWNRNALQGQGKTFMYDSNLSPGMEKYNRELFSKLGMNDKWADILSGTVRMAATFGRKLKEYGYAIDIAAGDIGVSEYAYYKGGLLRSNKTVKSEADPRDAENLRRQVENVKQSSAAMAKALGYSDEAIESFTGSLRINFKGAETAAEQSERYNEALQDLNRQMLNAATGANMTKEQFENFFAGIQQDIANAGISSDGIAQIIVDGMMGRLSQQEVGDQLADMIVGGIYNSIAQNYSGMIAEAFMGQIITPIFTAIAAGVPISQAISQQAIANVVATAQSAAAAMNAIFSDAGFQAAIAGIQQAIGGVAGAVTKVKVPKFGSAKTAAKSSAANAANQVAQERYNLETKLLQVLGKTDILRQRELASLNAANRALQLHIWAVEDAKDAVNSAMEALERAIDAERERLQKELDTALESERAINDVFDVLRRNIRELRGEVESTASMDASAARALIERAIGGEAIEADKLSDAIDSVRSALDAGSYSSRFERDKAMLSFAAQLERLSAVTETDLSEAEQQISLLEEQLERLDEQLDLAKRQVDALFGIDNSVKTVGDAIQALNDAMLGYTSAVAEASKVQVPTGAAPKSSSSSSGGKTSAGGGGSGGSTSTDPARQKHVEALYQYILGRPGDAGGVASYASSKLAVAQIAADMAASAEFNNKYKSRSDAITALYKGLLGRAPDQAGLNNYLNSSFSISQIAKILVESEEFKRVRGFATGGYYPGGLALVGEKGPELINFAQPGQVYTADQTRNILGGSNAEVVRLLRELIANSRAQSVAIAKPLVSMDKRFSRWELDGLPHERSEA